MRPTVGQDRDGACCTRLLLGHFHRQAVPGELPPGRRITSRATGRCQPITSGQAGRENTTDSTSLPSPDELPLACTLTPDDGATRQRRWEALAERANPTATRHDGTLEVRFQPGPGVSEELTALADAERDCCSFVDWQVAEDHGQPVLRVLSKGDPDDVAPIAILFGSLSPQPTAHSSAADGGPLGGA